MEAELMRRALPEAQFRAWFARFLPRAGEGAPSTLFKPVTAIGPMATSPTWTA